MKKKKLTQKKEEPMELITFEEGIANFKTKL